jgi:uncharacterized SAM-binding protein YcdF (DUF218 family)
MIPIALLFFWLFTANRIAVIGRFSLIHARYHYNGNHAEKKSEIAMSENRSLETGSNNPPPPAKTLYQQMGPDGIIVFLLSTGVMALACGTSYLLALGMVVKQGIGAVSVEKAGEWLLVFGMKLSQPGDQITSDYQLRLERAAKCYAHREGKATIIVMGGYTGGEVSEARAGMERLTAIGVDPAAIMVEDRSNHTLENLREARTIMENGEKQRGSVAFVSNRYHLARIGAIADGLGMEYRLVGAENERITLISAMKMLKEAYFLHWYYVGKWFSYGIQSRYMIDRIS